MDKQTNHSGPRLGLTTVTIRAYMHNFTTTGYIWPFSISNGCSTIGHIPCMVLNCRRDPTGQLRPQTGIGRSLIQTCVRILQALIYIAIWYATTPDNKTHAPYDYILHTKQRLYRQRCIVLYWSCTLILLPYIYIYCFARFLPSSKLRGKEDKLGVNISFKN